MVCLAIPLAGCGMTFQMPSLMGKDVEKTGYITSLSNSASENDPKLADLDEEDQRRAKSALALALDPQGPGTLVAWDNPDSKRKGSFSPDGAPFVENNDVCRAFIADISSHESLKNYFGKACRPSGEEWQIKTFQKKDNEKEIGKAKSEPTLKVGSVPPMKL